MSYTPTEWIDGKTPVNAENLNKMERGIQAANNQTAIAGKDGGHYIPTVTQPDANTMRMSYSASKEGMVPVEDVEITLPAGYTPVKGVDYYTDADKEELLASLDAANGGEGLLDKMKRIQPHNFPMLPYAVYRDTQGVYSCEDILSKRTEDFTTYYVDCENGSDSNNGTTRETAFKTLKTALTKYATSNRHCIIQIIGENPVFYAADLYGELLVKKSLVIKSEHRAKIIGGIKPTFAQHAEYTNVFVSNDLTGNTFSYCVNIADDNLDSMGLYKPMTKVESIALVDTTENSYYIENGIIYSSVDTAVALVQDFKWRFNHSLATEDHILYEENLNIIGANFRGARSTPSETDTKIVTGVVKNCIYQHNFRGNGLVMPDYDICYNIDTKCGYSSDDCFNYSASFCTEQQRLASVYVQVNCQAEEAGYYKTNRTYIENLTTAHEGINVARFNFSGYHGDGPMVADVNGCRSVLVDCNVLNLKYGFTATNINGCYSFNNVDAFRSGFITMQNCHGYDNRTNIGFLTSECDVEIRDCDIHGGFECEHLTVFNQKI